MGDVLVGSHHDDRAVAVDPALLEDVDLGVHRVDLLVVDEVERADAREEDLRHGPELDVRVVLLVDHLHVEPVVRPHAVGHLVQRRFRCVLEPGRQLGRAARGGGGGVGEHVDPPPTVGRGVVTEVDVVRVGDPRGEGRLEALAEREAGREVLVRRLADDGRRRVLGHEPRRELGRPHVEVGELRGVGELLRSLRHERRPLAVEVDEVLRDDLPLGRVGGQQALGAAALQHVPELPGEVEAVLHRHVHALPGLRAVRVAGVAGDEHARRARAEFVERDVVEAVGQSVPDLVDAVPGDVLHVEPVGAEDRVRVLDDLLDRGGPDRCAAARRHLTEVDVHAEQVPALAGDEQDAAARARLDRALRPDVREVRDGQGVHHTPGVVRLVAGEGAADRLAHAAPGAVRPDHVFRAHRPRAAGRVLAGVEQGHRHRVLGGVVDLEALERPAVVGSHARGCVGHVLGEVVEHARLVHDEVRVLADARRVVEGAGAADDAARVVEVGLPERHLGDPVRLRGDALREAERVEGLDAACLDAVRLADREASRSSLDDPRGDRREPGELGGGDHAGGPAADDEDVDLVRQLVGPVDPDPRGWKHARIAGDVAMVVELHRFLTSSSRIR